MTDADREQKLDENRLIKNPPKPKKRKTTVKSPIEKPVKEDKKYLCYACGTEYDLLEKNFIKSPHPMFAGNRGYIHVCKKCVDFFEIEYEKFHNNDSDAAVRHLCMYFGFYAGDGLIDMSRKINRQQTRMTTLASKQGMNQFVGKTYDTYLTELERGAINSIEDLQETQKTSDVNITERTVKAWGFGFSPEDYEFLNMQFSDWKARVVIDSKTRESLVRELCVIKLQINKALQSNNVDLYNKLLATYQKLLESANLSPKQEEANDKAGEKPIGVMIEMFENERPIPPPEDEWINSPMIKLVTVYFIGHLCKMVGIKNKYSKMYEEEMNRYKVEIPDFESSDEDDIFDYLICEKEDDSETTSEIDVESVLDG